MTVSLSAQTPTIDEQTARNFHTAVIATRSKAPKDHSSELYSLMKTPAFQAVLKATRQLAAQTGSTERAAAESIIQVIRKVDEIWSDYIFQEGVERLRAGDAGSVTSVQSGSDGGSHTGA